MSRGRESAASRRGNKTLAWFINDGILDNRESTSPHLRGTSMAEQRKHSVERRGSLASEKTDRSTPQSEHGEKQRRRNRRNDRRAHKKQTGSVHPATTEIDHSHTQNHANAAAAGGEEAVAKKEDYWYYDPVSDGFYYELNGSRGWRKRVPKIHGPPPMPTAAKRELQEQKPMQLPPAVLPNKLFPIAAAAAPPNVPSIKYYDAATDGYFYEMASVDGWRRRQPVAPSSAPDGSGFAHHVHHQQEKTTGAQRIAADLNAAPRSLPNSFAAQQQPPRRTMTNAEVEDMIVASTQRGAAESPFYSGIFSQQPITPTTAQPTSIGNSSPMLFSSVLSGSSVAAPQLSQSLQKSRLNAYMTADEYPSSLSSASSSAFDERMVKTSSMSSLEEFASPMPQDTVQADQQMPQQFNGLQAQERPKSLSISGRPSKLLPLYSRIDSYLPGFNVDAFIADLPPAVDHEKILNNLTALRTPLGDANAEQFGESPLFTPTHMRGELWDRLAASEGSTAATASKCRAHDSYDSAAVTLEQSLRDIEKLWHSAL